MSPAAASWAAIEARVKPACLVNFAAPPYGTYEGGRLVPWKKVDVRSSPSAAHRHHSLDCLTAPLAAPAVVNLDCYINGERRRLVSCTPTQEVSPELARAAIHRAAGFEIGGGKSTAAHPVHTSVSIRLDPDDRLALPRDRSLPVLKSSDVQWVMPWNSVNWSSYYPDRAQRLEIQANVVFLCRIQADLALICSDFAVRPSEQELFVSVASAIEANMHSQPTLTDGTKAAGRWVMVSLAFRVPE